MTALAQPDAGVDRVGGHDLTLHALCVRLHARHRDSIGIKKPAIAVPNLERIVAAALALAERGSFHEMSMRDLSRESGLSIGALYSYIRDKDGLLAMMLDVVTDAVERVLVGDLPAAPAHPLPRLRWLIDRHVHMTEAMPAWFSFAYMEAKGFGPAARERSKAAEMRTEALILGALEDGRRCGVFHVDDPALAAALIKPLLQDWYVKRGKYRRRGISAAAYVAAVSRLVETGLLDRDA